MVEVRKDHFNALVLLAEKILDGDFDVVECDEGRSGGAGVAGLDLGGLDALTAGDEQDTKAIVGLNGGGEILCEATVGDPPGN